MGVSGAPSRLTNINQLFRVKVLLSLARGLFRVAWGIYMGKLSYLATAAAALSLSSPAFADTLVYSSVPDITASADSPAWCSDCYGGDTYEVYDQFTLSSDASLSSLRLLEYPDYNTQFDIEIYSADQSTLLQMRSVTSAFQSNTAEGYEIWTGSFSDISLSAGSYWIGFIGARLALPSFSNPAGSIQGTPHTGQGSSLGSTVGYELYASAASPAPEPASWALMLGGFGLVGGALRTRRKIAVSFG
jgi:hypothetical protein